MIGKDMYYIFQPIEDSGDDEDSFYVRYPKEHLETALIRAKEVTKELKEAPPYRVETISATNMFEKEKKTTSANDAMEIFKKNIDQSSGRSFRDYQSGEGLFMFDNPIKVTAVIPGVDLFKMPAVHVIYEAKDSLEYYIQQAEIIEEFIEHALKLEDPRIGWSG